MASGKGFQVVVATDGSPQGQAAVATAAGFPWPTGARARVVIARGAVAWGKMPGGLLAALGANLGRIAADARRTLARRLRRAEAVVLPVDPVEAIISQARRLQAGAIVVGSRGHGALGRLVLGSVSRGVVRRARCPVLVVKGRARGAGRAVIGVDGSAGARRAVDFVCGLLPPPRGRVTLVSVLEPMRAPSLGLLPAPVRSALRGEVAAVHLERLRRSRKDLDEAAARLQAAGWKTETWVRTGVPAPELLRAAKAARADFVAVGARGVGGVERLLLGSVAESVLNDASVPVLVAR
ncbi:MAG: universal stress protein [Candidatus Rokubacteria bacterium]|nr:universal stress protein [Candidatus Rokubacteria bacterium]